MSSFVYFIKPVGMVGPIKIGCSGVPEDRLVALALWSPFPLEIVVTVAGNFKDENYLHNCFAKSRSHKEWFYHSDRLQAVIDRLIAGEGLEAVKRDLKPEGSISSGYRRQWTPEHSLRMSYHQRISWAVKRTRALDEHGAWDKPDDVGRIMNVWSGSFGFRQATPTAEQIERLDQYLADPVAHSVIPSWRREDAAA